MRRDALFFGGIGLLGVMALLMMHWDSGAPGAVWALVGALAILAAVISGFIWLYLN